MSTHELSVTFEKQRNFFPLRSQVKMIESSSLMSFYFAKD